MKLLMYCATERIASGGFRVRFVRDGIFKIRKFDNIVRAMDWITRHFDITKDELLLTITKY